LYHYDNTFIFSRKDTIFVSKFGYIDLKNVSNFGYFDQIFVSKFGYRGYFDTSAGCPVKYIEVVSGS
jgi:hypothetical protein